MWMDHILFIHSCINGHVGLFPSFSDCGQHYCCERGCRNICGSPCPQFFCVYTQKLLGLLEQRLIPCLLYCSKCAFMHNVLTFGFYSSPVREALISSLAAKRRLPKGKRSAGVSLPKAKQSAGLSWLGTWLSPGSPTTGVSPVTRVLPRTVSFDCEQPVCSQLPP